MLRTFLLFLLCLLLAFPQGAFSASSGKASAQVDTGLPLNRTTFHFFSPEDIAANYKASRIIRVGYFDQHGVFEGEGEHLSGYAVALLTAVSRYTGWEYEWVRIRFDELAQRLNDGTIDLSCGISFTPERAHLYSFSKLRAGYENTCLHVSSTSDMHYMDLEAFNGMRIGFFTDFSGKFGVKLFQYPGSQCKTSGKLAGCTCYAGGGIGEFSTHLRLSAAKVNGASFARSVAIIHLIFIGQAHAGVVAVVGNLVVQFARSGIHAVQPVQPPFYFVYYIGDAVCFRQSGCIVGIAECLGVFLVGKHHLVYGIGGSRGILQVVGSIVPAAAHIDVLPGFCGVVHYVAVVYVATVFQEWVVTATLLAHVVQQEVGCAVIYLRIDREAWRNCFSRFQVICARFLKITEIQPVSTAHAA